ncbi:MAG: hypothetical protein ACETWQ_07940 [Phycisphaerae bacterium]
MCRKSIYLILFVLTIVTTSGQAEVTPVTSVVITRVDNPGGAPNFWLESITVGGYTVTVDELVTGLSEGAATAQPAPYNDITVADNFDLNLFAGRADEVPPTWQIKELGGRPVWTDTNRDNPDFFLFETGGNQDFSIEAILPGGIIGQSVNVPQSTFGDTGLVITTSGPHNGQTIEGVAFAVTDLLDQNGNNLTNSSIIEGIQISSPGLDPSGFYASVGGPVLVASNPDPADGVLYADTWVNLSWSPGDFAISHDVYFSDNFDDVNDGAESAFQGNQTATFLVAGFPGFPVPDGLVPGMTYYWRIDEVNDTEPNSPWKGPVWSFMIPPKTAYAPDPVDGAESVDLNIKLSWTAGFGAKLHYAYFGDNFDDVNNATGGLPLGDATFDPGPLDLAKTYYWRVDEFDIVETHKGEIWSFTTEGAVGIPNPANGAVDVKQTQIITWSPSVFAASHQLYFGTDKDAVKNADTGSPEYKGTRDLGAESYDPGKLQLDTTYYWRIDEANNTNPDSPWKGNVWSFTTANFLVVDDFESYNDIDPPDPESNRIFEAWLDGYEIPTNGALVGNDLPPYAEQTIVHSGNQSMPLFYDNSVGYSEATLTLTYPRDWTEKGVNRLTIWFRGNSDNAAETLYVALNGSAVVNHDNPDAAQTGRWTEWSIPLRAFADQGVNLANVNTIAIGLGNKKNPIAGGSGTIYIDDIRLYRPVP